jgi:hypothetical protein
MPPGQATLSAGSGTLKIPHTSAAVKPTDPARIKAIFSIPTLQNSVTIVDM